MSERVIISRDTRGETVNGKPRAPRVYITGPHFGSQDIFSSTEDPSEATEYERHEAEALLALGKWRMHHPQIVVR
jgi:hypothetical protein